MAHSTTPKADDKAAVLAAARKHKAKDKVPLLAHATMRWGRKINGRLHYFGKVDGTLPEFGAGAALAEYHRTVDELRAGREPRPKDSDFTTLAEAANRFLSAKTALRDSGELAPRTWTNYHQTCSHILDVLGKHRAVADLQPDDFRKLRTAFGKGRGVVSVLGDVTRSRVFFKFCDTEGLVDRPVKYGTGFDLPNPKAIRLAREARGIRMFEPDEIRQLLAAADPAMKAMILHGVNAAFGQSDLARLPKSAIDLERGWIAFGRPKTGIARKCPWLAGWRRPSVQEMKRWQLERSFSSTNWPFDWFRRRNSTIPTILAETFKQRFDVMQEEVGTATRRRLSESRLETWLDLGLKMLSIEDDYEPLPGPTKRWSQSTLACSIRARSSSVRLCFSHRPWRVCRRRVCDPRHP